MDAGSGEPSGQRRRSFARHCPWRSCRPCSACMLKAPTVGRKEEGSRNNARDCWTDLSRQEEDEKSPRICGWQVPGENESRRRCPLAESGTPVIHRVIDTQRVPREREAWAACIGGCQPATCQTNGGGTDPGRGGESGKDCTGPEGPHELSAYPWVEWQRYHGVEFELRERSGQASFARGRTVSPESKREKHRMVDKGTVDIGDSAGYQRAHAAEQNHRAHYYNGNGEKQEVELGNDSDMSLAELRSLAATPSVCAEEAEQAEGGGGRHQACRARLDTNSTGEVGGIETGRTV